MDDGVGRLLQKLRELKIEENTLVFFLSDNGGPENKNASDNGPLRDGKGSLYEGGVRVPFVVQWPGTIPKGTVYTQPVISLDLFATAVALAEAPVSPERPLDGVNLIPYLTGKMDTPPHDAFYWDKFKQGDCAMLTGETKLVKDRKSDRYEMYNLANDLGEKNDLASAHPEAVNTQSQKLEAWKKELKPAAFPGLSEVWWK